MEEKIVEFRTAELASEKGFNTPCRNAYNIKSKEIENALNFTGEEFFTELEIEASNDNEDSSILAPDQSLLQKWLREVYGIHVEPKVDVIIDHSKYAYWLKVTKGAVSSGKLPSYVYNTYEEALEAGLVEALNLIEV